ncbi:hypothetical protein D3C85_1627920 [compost metagenome]
MAGGAVPPGPGRKGHAPLIHGKRHRVAIPPDIEPGAGHQDPRPARVDSEWPCGIGTDSEQRLSCQQLHLAAIGIQRDPSLRVRIQFQQ